MRDRGSCCNRWTGGGCSGSAIKMLRRILAFSDTIHKFAFCICIRAEKGRLVQWPILLHRVHVRLHLWWTSSQVGHQSTWVLEGELWLKREGKNEENCHTMNTGNMVEWWIKKKCDLFGSGIANLMGWIMHKTRDKYGCGHIYLCFFYYLFPSPFFAFYISPRLIHIEVIPSRGTNDKTHSQRKKEGFYDDLKKLPMYREQRWYIHIWIPPTQSRCIRKWRSNLCILGTEVIYTKKIFAKIKWQINNEYCIQQMDRFFHLGQIAARPHSRSRWLKETHRKREDNQKQFSRIALISGQVGEVPLHFQAQVFILILDAESMSECLNFVFCCSSFGWYFTDFDSSKSIMLRMRNGFP